MALLPLSSIVSRNKKELFIVVLHGLWKISQFTHLAFSLCCGPHQFLPLHDLWEIWVFTCFTLFKHVSILSTFFHCSIIYLMNNLMMYEDFILSLKLKYRYVQGRLNTADSRRGICIPLLLLTISMLWTGRTRFDTRCVESILS